MALKGLSDLAKCDRAIFKRIKICYTGNTIVLCSIMKLELTHSQKMTLQECGQRQITAAKNGNLQLLKKNYNRMDKILRRCGSEQHPFRGFSQQALTQACKQGQTQCAAFLIEHTDISYGEYVAVRGAIEGNHFDCLKLLMEHTTLPFNMYAFCLEQTVSNNQPQCLQILMEHYQDNIEYDTLLMTSAIRNQYECVDILYPIGNPKHVLMRIEAYHDEDLGAYLAAKLQQERLSAEVAVGSSVTSAKKM